MATSTLGSGTLVLAGTTSGTTTVTATAVAGTTTLTLPAATDTLVGKATTDTLTNKTLTGAAMNGTLGATTPSTVAATTISASSTATFAAGAAGTPSITTSGDTNTGIFFPAADTIAFAEGGVESMRIDASGNLLVGTTSTLGFTAGILVANSGANVQAITTNSTSSSAYYIGRFYSGGTEKGYIYFDGTNVSYTNLSDYRLKENVQPMQNALDKVAQLNPVTYNWKSNGKDGQGFIAHELQAVVPDCVTGDKDAVDEDGNPKYQGVDTSFLVATLTAAIKEQQALITTLTARISALESA